MPETERANSPDCTRPLKTLLTVDVKRLCRTIGEYPAGVDQGPAITGKGDLISVDGSPWQALSFNPDLDYNWNLQIYVSNAKGEEKMLNATVQDDPHEKSGSSVFPEVSSSI